MIGRLAKGIDSFIMDMFFMGMKEDGQRIIQEFLLLKLYLRHGRPRTHTVVVVSHTPSICFNLCRYYVYF